MDIFEENLLKTSKRLDSKRAMNFEALLGDGHTFQPVENSDLTSVYCYDAMVHFSPDIVESYLLDTHRVLRPKGKGLFHHSNYHAHTERHYGLNPHARNHMTIDLFEKYCNRAGLRILESFPIDWGGCVNLDRISLVQKP